MGSSIAVFIIGNVGNDPRLSQVGDQTVCNFNVAVNRGKGDKKQTLWVRCSIWGQQAESAAEFIHKRDQVQVEAHWLRQQVYQGQPSLDAFCDRFTLLNNQRDDNGSNGSNANDEGPSLDIPF